MRRFLILAVTALLLSPARAQEEKKELSPEDREVVELLLRMRSDDAEEAEKARRRMMKLLVGRLGRTVEFDTDALVLLDPKGPSESIRGTSTDENGKLEYTLKRLGQGKYELEAKRSDPGSGKILEKIVDKGTMAELAKKHAFLQRTPMRGGLGVGGLVVHATPGPHGARMLGAFATRPSEDLAYHLYLPKGVGYVVRHVAQGSQAEQLGLKPFDVLAKVDGKWIEDPRQLERARTLEYFRRAAAAKVTLE
jgi:hypothetical protein